MIKELLRVELPEYHDGGMDDYRAHVDRAKAPLFDKAREMGFVPYGDHKEYDGLGGVYSTWSESGHEDDLLPPHFLIVDAGIFVLPREAALTEHTIELPPTTMAEFAAAMKSVQAFFAHNAVGLSGRASLRDYRQAMDNFLERLAGNTPAERTPDVPGAVR